MHRASIGDWINMEVCTSWETIPTMLQHCSHDQHPTHTLFYFRAHQRPCYETRIAALKATVDAGTCFGTRIYDVGYSVAWTMSVKTRA